MAKLFYAQKDALGFPIPGTMMSADTVPAADNVIAITIDGSLQFDKEHPQGLRYFVYTDRGGNILPNTLISAYDAPAGTVELGTAVSRCITFGVIVPEAGGQIDFGLETYDRGVGRYVTGSIDWNDGSEPTAINVLDDGNTDRFFHEYTVEGEYLITVCINRPQLIQDVELGRGEGGLAITNVNNIENWDGIDELDLSYNELTSFDIDGMASLDELYIDNNELTYFSVANCPILRSIELTSNPSLSAVELTNCSNITQLYLNDCGLTQNSLYHVLNTLNSFQKSNGYLNLTGESMPSPNAQSLGMINVLQSRNWTVEYNESTTTTTISE